MIAVLTAFKGAFLGLMLAGLFLAVACGGADDAADSSAHEDGDSESEEAVDVFSQESIDYLFELLEADAGEYGLVGGCIWPDGVHDNNRLYPSKLLEWDGWVASGTWGSAPGVHVATIYRPDYAGEPVTDFDRAEFDAVEGPDSLCYEPNEQS